MVECQLPKLDVAGSIPVSRSIPFNHFPISIEIGFILNFHARTQKHLLGLNRFVLGRSPLPLDERLGPSMFMNSGRGRWS